MFGLFKKKKPVSTEPTPRKKKSAKDIATEKGEAFFEVVHFEYDPQNPTVGSFELEWNDIFVKQLRMSGYQGMSDEDVVDNYFTSVCRNIVLETYEKEMADPSARQQTDKRDLGNGRAEYSQ